MTAIVTTLTEQIIIITNAVLKIITTITPL